ncbi:MAG: acyltransferase family protein [Syntrophus sp. (in: bacteria)]
MCCAISDIKPQRIKWIDELRAFAILMVLIGHKTENVYLEEVIYSFHVPLFFWIAGFVFDQSKYNQFTCILIKKSKTLLLPYFVFALSSFLFWLVIVRSLSLRGQAFALNAWLPFWGLFYGIGVDPWRNPMDNALWFLPCLFVTDMYFWCINNYFRKIIRPIALILFGIFGYCISIFMPFRLPWSADVAFIAVIFYYFGNITKRFNPQIDATRLAWKFFIMGVLAIAIALLSKANGKVDMNYNYYGNIFLFFITAFSGIYLSYFTVQMLPHLRIVSYIGKNTIIIVGLAGVSAFIVSGFNYIVFHNIPSHTKLDFPMTIYYSLLEIGLLIPIIFLINRFIPFITGRQRVNG